MARTKKRKAATVAGVSVVTAALLLGGTFAWQSISQMALNENKAGVNPGARLHDDYTGNYAKKSEVTNRDVGIKRVYVENFTKEDEKVSVIARVRLDEYMEIGASAGYKKLTKTANGNYIKAGDDNGVIELVSEDTTTTPGSVIITVKPIPYTGNTIDTVTADPGTGTTVTANTDGTYTCTVPDTTPVTITATFTSGTTTGDTIEKAKTLVEKANDGTTPATIDDVKTWKTYIPELAGDGKTLKDSTSSAFRNYVDLTFGWDSTYADGGIYYMPTFNKNKDSLSADINGTYAAEFSDYVDYADSANQTVTADAEYDNDANDVDDGNVYTEKEKHTAQALSKTKSNVISMEQWKTDYNMAPGDYWVYDTNDGWAYWANLLEPETATGLFLSRNEMTGTPEDNWYYGMNVVGQFVTSEDIGSASNKVGFYADDAGEKPSADAKTLLGILKSLSQANPLSLTSGDRTEITSMKSGVVPTALTDNDGGTWTVTDEEVVAVTVDEIGKVWAQAKRPGDAVIAYTSADNEVTAVKVRVDYQTYEITRPLVTGAVRDDIFDHVVIYEEDDDNTTVTIKSYYTENDVYYKVVIAARAFITNTQINALILEEGFSSIDDYAFAYCTNLTGSLEIPKSVVRLGMFAFYGCAFEQITLNEGLEVIGMHALTDLKNVDSLTIPASVTQIDAGAFWKSTFKELKIAEGNQNFCVEEMVLYDHDKTKLLWYSPEKENTTFSIPNTVTEIDTYAIRNIDNLQSIIIPEGVTTINKMAFAGCINLQTIKIPASVTSIGIGAFSAEVRLEEIQIDEGNVNYAVEDGILYNADKTSLICCPGGKGGKIIIPDGVTAIEPYAFWAMNEMTSIVIPTSLSNLSELSFVNCSKLNKISYKGTEEEWNVSPLSDYEFFKDVTVEYNYQETTE